MDYTVFDKVKAEFARRADEPEQAYMERLFRAVCEGSDGEQRVNNLLAPRFCACDAAEHTLTLEYTAQPWMLNSKGTLHGGILSSTLLTLVIVPVLYRMAEGPGERRRLRTEEREIAEKEAADRADAERREQHRREQAAAQATREQDAPAAGEGAAPVAPSDHGAHRGRRASLRERGGLLGILRGRRRR